MAEQQVQSNTPAATPVTPTPEPIERELPILTEALLAEYTERLDKAEEEVDLIAARDMHKQIKRILEEQGGRLRRSEPELYKAAQEQWARAAWMHPRTVWRDNITELLQRHFEGAYQFSWGELLDELSLVLEAEPLYEERDRIKKDWVDAINTADALLGSKPITVQGQEVEPTMQNWLRDWRTTMENKPSRTLSIVEYLNTNENVRILTDRERDILEGVLKLITELEKSSQTAEGSEDMLIVQDPESGNYLIFDRGQLIDTGIALSEQELLQTRQEQGYHPDGRPMSTEEIVQLFTFEEDENKDENEDVAQLEGADSKVVEPVEEPEDILEPDEPGDVEEPAQPATTEPEDVFDDFEFPELELEPLHDDQEDIEPEEATANEPAPTPEPAVEDIAVEAATAPLPPVQPMPTPPIPPTPAPAPNATPAPKPAAPEPAAPNPVPEPAAELPTVPEVPDRIGEVNYAAIARRVLAEFQILFESYDLERRFISILNAYLQEVRNREQTIALLHANLEDGGVDMQKNQAQQVMATADELLGYAQRQPAPRKKKVAQPRPAAMNTPSIDMLEKQMARKRIFDELTKGADQVQASEPQAEPIEDIFANTDSLDIDRAVVTEVDEQAEETKKSPLLQVRQQEAPARASLMGPIEELQQMTLDEFRAYGSSTPASVKKLKKKFQLLERESIARKAEGIAAWQMSPLHELYVTTGKMSLRQGMPVEAVIQRIAQEGGQSLTLEEFDAISDLNRELRF